MARPSTQWGLKVSAERLSVLIGLIAVMLSAVPGYLILEDHQRLTLMAITLVAVIVVTIIMAIRLGGDQRARLGRLSLQLLLALAIGCMVMAVWQALSSGVQQLPQWASLLPAGMTTGLLLHVLLCWWRAPRHT